MKTLIAKDDFTSRGMLATVLKQAGHEPIKVILIINDDSGLRTTLVDILEFKGYATLVAKDGADGLALMQKSRVDLALIDFGLPGLSGLDILSRIKTDHPSTAIIILTGTATLESAIEATNRGAFSYLVKPYETEQLILQVRRALEKQQVDKALRESEAKFFGLLESSADGILIVNDKQEILLVNRQFELMFGYDRSEVIGKQIEMLIPSNFNRHQGYFREYVQDPKTKRMGQRKESYALRKDGSKFPTVISLSPQMTPQGLIISTAVRDITERKRYEAQLEHQANHDELTGLPNRNLLMDRLNQALLYTERNQRLVGVLFLDLDNFKFINDSLGHNVGDRLLKIVAKRLKACCRSNDTVACQGGDDFIIVLPDLVDGEDAAIVAKKIHIAVNQPVEVDTQIFDVSCSIGISIHPKDGKDAPTMLKNAELAMFRAKEQGRSTFQFFTDELNTRVVARMTMERSLRRALENEELSLHYQPQVDLITGQINGVEALLRWFSPDLGMVSPAQFIPLAEETGLILPIGEWVLKTAGMQNKQWREAGLPHITMAVNLSPRQFWDPGLIKTVSEIIRDSGIAPRYLDLEITEGLVVRDVESALSMLHELKEMGVQLSMDDFGTGYSSLSHLKRFPFDKLKMDISFVRELTSAPGSAAIAKTIIAMAHNLNLRVIAEGVETEGQLNYLRCHGCDEIQGFFFSRPVPAAEVEQLLREGRQLCFPEKESAPPEKTLLIVDDEPLVLATIADALSEYGYRILSTTNASQGFELLAINQVGVVLCDQRMPGMSGLEFLRRVKDLHPNTIRIALSGYADMDMVTSAINQGAIYKFFTKPIAMDVLRKTIVKAFAHFEAVSAQK